MRRLILLAICYGTAAVGLWWGEPLLAQDTDGRLFGPLRIRDLSPLSLIFMDFVPAHAVEGPAGVLALEFHISQANTFIMSENIRDHLSSRDGGRQSLLATDFAAISEFDGDAFYFDGEAGVVNLTAHYSITKKWEAYLSVPFLHYDGGFFDSEIESFHESFGFGTAGRDLVSRNQLQFLLKLGDDSLALLDTDGEAGFSDPSFGLRYRMFRGKWHVVFEGAVKVPVAEKERFLSSGQSDFGAQASLHRQGSKNGVYVALSYVVFGDADLLPTFQLDSVFTLSAAWERTLSRRFSIVLQGSASPSPYGDTDASLSSDRLQVSVGARYVRRVGRAFEFAITENVSNFDSTPDIGFHLGFALPVARFGKK